MARISSKASSELTQTLPPDEAVVLPDSQPTTSQAQEGTAGTNRGNARARSFQNEARSNNNNRSASGGSDDDQVANTLPFEIQLVRVNLTLLGQRLRTARLERRLSQRTVCEGLFTSAYLSSLELGKTRPTLQSLQGLASKLGKPLNYFLKPNNEPLVELDDAGNVDANYFKALSARHLLWSLELVINQRIILAATATTPASSSSSSDFSNNFSSDSFFPSPKPNHSTTPAATPAITAGESDQVENVNDGSDEPPAQAAKLPTLILELQAQAQNLTIVDQARYYYLLGRYAYRCPQEFVTLCTAYPAIFSAFSSLASSASAATSLAFQSKKSSADTSASASASTQGASQLSNKPRGEEMGLLYLLQALAQIGMKGPAANSAKNSLNPDLANSESGDSTSVGSESEFTFPAAAAAASGATGADDNDRQSESSFFSELTTLTFTAAGRLKLLELRTRVLYELGSLYFEQGQLHTALSHFHSGWELLNSQSTVFVLAAFVWKFEVSLARVYQAMNQLSQSQYWAGEAQSHLARQFGLGLGMGLPLEPGPGPAQNGNENSGGNPTDADAGAAWNPIIVPAGLAVYQSNHYYAQSRVYASRSDYQFAGKLLGQAIGLVEIAEDSFELLGSLTFLANLLVANVVTSPTTSTGGSTDGGSSSVLAPLETMLEQIFSLLGIAAGSYPSSSSLSFFFPSTGQAQALPQSQLFYLPQRLEALTALAQLRQRQNRLEEAERVIEQGKNLLSSSSSRTTPLMDSLLVPPGSAAYQPGESSENIGMVPPTPTPPTSLSPASTLLPGAGITLALAQLRFYQVAAEIEVGRAQPALAQDYYEQALTVIGPTASGGSTLSPIIKTAVADLAYSYGQRLKEWGDLAKALLMLEKAFEYRSTL